VLRIDLDGDVNKFFAVGMVCLLAILCTSSPASAESRGSALKISDLPAGWVAEPSSSGLTPPCLASAEQPLARFPETKSTGAGETGQLAQFVERVISVPRSFLLARYSEVVSRFLACNGSTWTRGTKSFQLSIESRVVPALRNAQVTGFLVSIASPSVNVEPNPYPGLVDFAVVGDKVVLLSMQFTGVPIDTAIFDSIESKAVARAA
jgi:hypothetical protein